MTLKRRAEISADIFARLLRYFFLSCKNLTINLIIKMQTYVFLSFSVTIDNDQPHLRKESLETRSEAKVDRNGGGGGREKIQASQIIINVHLPVKVDSNTGNNDPCSI